MTLRVPKSDLDLLASTDREVLLGIIESDGRVRLRLADAVACRGHVEWIRQSRVTNVHRGFSLIVKNGRVAAIHRRSEINPSASDYVLEKDATEELLSLLPGGVDAEIFPGRDDENETITG